MSIFVEDDFQLSFLSRFLSPLFKILNEHHSVSNLGALAAFERELKQRGRGRQSPFRHCVSFHNVVATGFFRPKKRAYACVTLQATGAPFSCASRRVRCDLTSSALSILRVRASTNCSVAVSAAHCRRDACTTIIRYPNIKP